MALVKYGGGIVQASGSLAGNTFSRNKSGNYMRARTTPINPNTGLQTAARARLSYLAEYWANDLTEPQRQAWHNYADSVTMANRLGESIHISGSNMYIRSNTAILQAGFPQVDDGPTELTLPESDPTFAVELSAASGITITFDDTFAWIDEDEGGLTIQLGQPQNASRTFFGGPWRYDSTLEGDSVTPLTSPDGPNASATWTLIEGHRVWFRAKILRADGRASNYFGQDSALVGA